MKIELINGLLTARPETADDVEILMSFRTAEKSAPVKNGVGKHGPWTVKKCDICGKNYKKAGIKIHRYKAHIQIRPDKKQEAQTA